MIINKRLLLNNDENKVYENHMTGKLLEADLFALEDFIKRYPPLV